jgi:putative membrane protein
MLGLLLAALHLLALGIGLGAVLTRGSLLRNRLDATAVRLVMRYDAMWGIAAILWISTGLWRWLGSVEKTASYYTGNHVFLTKMTLLALIVVLEVKPMVTLIRWRKGLGKGLPIEEVARAGEARTIARTSHIQALIVVVMVVLAAAVARGIGG